MVGAEERQVLRDGRGRLVVVRGWMLIVMRGEGKRLPWPGQLADGRRPHRPKPRNSLSGNFDGFIAKGLDNTEVQA